MDKDDNQMLEALTESSLQAFHEKIEMATLRLYERWESRDEIDTFYLTLDVLFFRNCKLHETIEFLLRHDFLNGAEMILRALYEGVVIFEWCMIDPKRRALRFRRTTMGGTLQLVDQGYLKRSAEYIQNLRDVSQWFIDNGYKNLPDFKQMVNELSGLRSGYAYDFYKDLSKRLHAVSENWDDYLDYEEGLRLRRSEDVSRRQMNSCYAAACFFQMRNIAFVSAFDEFMDSRELQDLEYAWALLYPILERYEHSQGN